jgi:signal transduction histidine kinase
LAIVDATVRAHGGAATLTSRPGAGTTVRIELPTAGAPV